MFDDIEFPENSFKLLVFRSLLKLHIKQVNGSKVSDVSIEFICLVKWLVLWAGGWCCG